MRGIVTSDVSDLEKIISWLLGEGCTAPVSLALDFSIIREQNWGEHTFDQK